MAFYEEPLYKVPVVRSRFLIPKLIILLALGGLFYGGVLINIMLLDLSASNETLTKIITFFFLTAIIALGMYITYVKAEKEYHFYRTWMELGNEKVLYTAITQATTEQNIWDKLFHTNQIKIPGHTLRHVPEELHLDEYINKLVVYAQNKGQ